MRNTEIFEEFRRLGIYKKISETFGLCINLTYNFNETRNKILRFRTGEIALDEQLNQILIKNK